MNAFNKLGFDEKGNNLLDSKSLPWSRWERTNLAHQKLQLAVNEPVPSSSKDSQ
jgi:hypothetical protein